MLRAIDIPKLAYQLLRPNYALTNGLRTEKGYCSPQLNTLYRFILSLIYPLLPTLESWDRSRRKSYAIAACQYGLAQVLAILNKYYGQYGQIRIQVNSANANYFILPERRRLFLYICILPGAPIPRLIFIRRGLCLATPQLLLFPKNWQIAMIMMIS